MQWRPNFKQEKMFIWAQFIDLLVEYFNTDAFFKLAKAIGRPVKMDIQTSKITGGRFARVCIEIDIKNPLPPFIMIINTNRRCGMNYVNFCNKCGIIGHLPIQCAINQATWDGESAQQIYTSKEKDWRIIEKKRMTNRNPRNGANIKETKQTKNRKAQVKPNMQIRKNQQEATYIIKEHRHNGGKNMIL